jgi:hypothetical protein
MSEGLKSRHELRAAHYVARALHAPQTSLLDARESFHKLPNGGMLGSGDFDPGCRVLVLVQLVAVYRDQLAVTPEVAALAELSEHQATQLLLELLLERRPPAWLGSAATGSSVRTSAIPDMELKSLEDIIEDPSQREVLLLHAAERINLRRLEELGSIGEEHVVDQCKIQLKDQGRDDLADEVQQVSLISDRLGYDVVAPTLDGRVRRLEVKATRRVAEKAEIFISRNEFERSRTDPDWALVVVKIDHDDQPQLVGWCRGEAFEQMMPRDRDTRGHWASTRILRVGSLLQEGLPPV